MSGYRRSDLPADIAVFAGDFASQPLVFAHLLDTAPELDLGAVEVIQGAGMLARLRVYFDDGTARELLERQGAQDTLVLILPAAYDTLACPVEGSALLTPLGTQRGTVPRLVAE